MRTPWLLGLLLASSSCAVVVRGSKLSDRYVGQATELYLSTGGANRPFRTLGFAQVRGFGVEVAGAVDLGEAAIDGAIRGALAQAARSMGGQGVIHIEFLDENPSTPVERAQSFSNTVSSSQGPQTKPRYVTVTGEVIQFLDPKAP